MNTLYRARWLCLALFLTLAAGGTLALNLLRPTLFVAYADPVDVHYTGSGACAAAACHGNALPNQGIGNANNIWHDKDPHRHAFDGDNGLRNDRAKEIAKKLNIADAEQSNRCLLCHSTSALTLNAPIRRRALKANERDPRFDAAEGVSCDGCHGPASKRIEPHVAAGWAQRIQGQGVDKMFDNWGMLALKDAHMRANSCISCHLYIDPNIVDAGHPELSIELADFSSRDWIHWRDNKPWYSVRLWAVGQAVALRDAACQMGDRGRVNANPKRIKAAYQKLIGHALMARQAAAVIDPPALNAIDAQLRELHGNWENRVSLEAAMRALYAVAEKFAAKANTYDFKAADVETIRKGVVAEADTAGILVNYPACENISFTLLTLNSAMSMHAQEDVALHQDEVGSLFEHGSIEASFFPEMFVKAARKLGAKIPGGKVIPLPPNAPKY